VSTDQLRGESSDRRFGYRRRAYIAHIAKTISIPIYRETSKVWKAEFDEVSDRSPALRAGLS